MLCDVPGACEEGDYTDCNGTVATAGGGTALARAVVRHGPALRRNIAMTSCALDAAPCLLVWPHPMARSVSGRDLLWPRPCCMAASLQGRALPTQSVAWRRSSTAAGASMRAAPPCAARYGSARVSLGPVPDMCCRFWKTVMMGHLRLGGRWLGRRGRAQSRCRCGRGEPTLCAAVAGVSPVLEQMLQG